MIRHRRFTCEPWVVRETELNLSSLAQSEAILALSNGHIGLRANLEEGEPHGLPGTYLNSFYETYPLPYAEDRKSTRLNSSHANISYAVFCLKKKNKQY